MLDAVIIGAGPAGLAAGFSMARAGASVVVAERLDQVGGLARTVVRDGCRFDIGPHRFFTKNDEVRALYSEVLAQDVVTVNRLTRILYHDKYFNYPLTPLNAITGLGAGTSVAILASYLKAKLGQRIDPREPKTFEQWTSREFGDRLFTTFFKTYTEKVWGIPCSRIGADWAEQRIKGLSLGEAIRSALLGPRQGQPKTLVNQFMFPRLGSGMFYERLQAYIESTNCRVMLRSPIVKLHRDNFRIRSAEVGTPGGTEELHGRWFISSAPLTEMVRCMEPSPPEAVLRACRKLRYRDHVAVNLKVRGVPFPDNWVYVHDERVRLARVTNHRNFSVAMTDDADMSPLTAEYFAFKGDDVWSLEDSELVELSKRELQVLGVVQAGQVDSGFVIRSEKSYPVIEIGFAQHVDTIRSWLGRFENLQPIGRSGMFKYNNQDHAIATGLLAAKTALGLGRFDPWRVNIDAEYQEVSPTASS